MSILFGRKQYKELCNEIQSQVSEYEMDEIEDWGKVLILAGNAKGRFQFVLSKLLQKNKKLQLLVVAQLGLAEEIQRMSLENCEIIEWDGNYTQELFSVIKNYSDVSRFDSFIFFPKEKLSERDSNILLLFQELEKAGVHFFGVISTEGQIYQYKNVGLIANGLTLLGAAERYLEELRIG